MQIAEWVANNDGIAAWVQAIATIVALALALAQGYGAIRREKLRQRAAATGAVMLVQDASQELVHLYSDLIHASERATAALRILESGRLNDVAGALNAVDVTALPKEQFVYAVVSARGAVVEFRRALENILLPLPSPHLGREPYRPIEQIQRASSSMVEPLTLMNPGAWWRVPLGRLKAWIARRKAAGAK